MYRLPVYAALIAAASTLVACSARVEESPEYQAACEGQPLRTAAKRQQAMEDGYNVNARFDCIDKASYLAEQEIRAAYRAANTPEARAEEARKQAQALARLEQEREWKARQEQQSRPHLVLGRVDANTAPEGDIAGIFAVGPEVAAQIAAERAKRRFTGWDDLVSRVTGLSAAQSAFGASTCGLTVDGRSMPGAPLDAGMAALLYQRRFGQQALVELAP